MTVRSTGLRRPLFHRALLAGCAAVAFAASSNAQQANPASSQEIEEIVVRGINLQRLLATQAKRESDAIIDAVSADDLGRLPDRNTAESLARLPGVSITQDQGEGRYVSIRGASPNLNSITVNGLAVGTVEENSRRVPLDILGGELLGGIEVVKAVTPDREANAIGGYIDVKTPSPFNFEEPFFGRATAQIGKDEYSTFTPYSGNFLTGGKFGSDETIGVLLGASYTDRHYLTKGLYVDDWREVPGSTRGIPQSHKFNDYDLDRKRLSFSGALEIKPDDDNLYFLRAIWTEARESEIRYRNRNYFSRVTTAGRFTITPGTDSGTYTNQRFRIELRDESKKRRIGNFSAGGENRFDNWEIKYAASLISNRTNEPNQSWTFQSPDIFSGTYDMSPEYFEVRPQINQIVANVGRFALNSYSIQEQLDTDKGGQGKVDLKYDLSGEMNGYIKTGVLVRSVKKSQDVGGDTYATGTGGLAALNLGLPGLLDGTLVEGNVKGQFYETGPRISRDGIDQFTAANLNNPVVFAKNAAASLSNSVTSDFKTKENIFAGYLMGSATFDQLNVLAGVRVEHTDVSSVASTLTNGTTITPVARDGKYTNFMPGIHLRYGDVDAPVVLRAAWTNTIGRPEYPDIAARRSLGQTPTTPGRFDGSLDQGNPDLKAFESMNFDVSAEYYLGKGGIISAAGFYKDIDNFIFNERLVQNNVTFEGVAYDQLVIQTPRNGNKGKVKGIELNYQQQWDFLPGILNGLGGGFSATFVDSSLAVPGRTDKLPLVGQADTAYSATLFYQKGPFEAVLSYDWADDILVDVGGDTDGDIYDKSYGRLDLRTSYSVTENLNVFLDVLNINEAPLGEFQGRKTWITRREIYGISAFVGATVKW